MAGWENGERHPAIIFIFFRKVRGYCWGDYYCGLTTIAHLGTNYTEIRVSSVFYDDYTI